MHLFRIKPYTPTLLRLFDSFSRRLFHDTVNFQFISDGTSEGAAAIGAMAAVCEQDYATLKDIFGIGDVPGRPFVVTVDPSAGGAYHDTCDGTAIHVIPQDAPSLLVAEVVECFEALTGKWYCGLTAGEGLSRALAITVRPFQVLGGVDGDVRGWWNGGNPRDFVNDNSQDDQNEQANACGTLFLFWVNSLGYTWNQIATSNGITLGAMYSQLTGKTGRSGFAGFVTALAKIPQPWADNPFAPTPLPTPVPVPEPTPIPAPVPQPSGCNPFGWVINLFK
jgi:hypothetical protein